MTWITEKSGGRAAVAIGLALALLVAASLPAVASAEAGNPGSDPTAAQYAKPAFVEASAPAESAPAGAAAGVSQAAGGGGETLPLTGLDLVSLAAVAIALVGIGFALRRVSSAEGS